LYGCSLNNDLTVLLSHAGVSEFQDRKRWESARGWGVHKQRAKHWTLGEFVLVVPHHVTRT